ncbi:MAG: serine/threonine-protein kinase [Nannocystaceae bacterium]
MNTEPVAMAPDRAPSSLEGATVGGGRFRVGAELGRGGMSEVYRAFDAERGQEVALKVIAARYVGRPERERRFLNEASFARRVAGEAHVVTVWDDGVLSDRGDRPFMTMEVIEGPTLAMELATRRRIAVPQAMEWACQIAAGLRALHESGIAHRDLTPCNLLIERCSELVKIFDFGLAAELDSPGGATASRLTLLGEAPGSHGYMAPEQVSLGTPAGAMDVYAFGVVLTEMLVGHNPFAHLDRAEYIEWQRTTKDAAPSIARWGLRLPEGLEALIDDCLKRDPADRPRDGGELVARLEALRRPAVVALVPVRRGEPWTDDDDDDVDEEAETIEGKTPRVRRTRPWAWPGLLGVALLLGGIAVGWWMAGATSDGPPPRAPVVPKDQEVGPSVETERVEPPRTSPAVEGPSPEPRPSAEPSPPPRPPRTKTRRPRRTKPREPSDEAPVVAAPCTDEADATAAYRDQRWPAVLEHTQSTRCWPDATARMRLRTRALFELGQFEECARLGATVADVETRRLAKHCSKQLIEESPP